MNNLLNPQNYSWLIRKHPKIIMNLRIEKARRQRDDALSASALFIDCGLA